MITLTKLNWSNCFSYGPFNELDLSKETLTQILGTNGMGKSSIPLIIEEALFNKNSKGIKKADIPNRYINDGYKIRLEFTKDADSYIVDIQRKSNIKVSLFKNGEDISSHTATNTYKTLQEIIGTDFKTFTQLVYQNTNASLQFLTATDANRKKFLIDLLNLEEYVRLFEIFKEAAKESNSILTSIDAKIATIEKWLKDNKLTSSTILPMLELEIDTDEDEKQLRSLTIEIENISRKNKKILENNQYKKLLSNINLDKFKEDANLQKQSYDSLQEELGNIQAQATNAKKMIDKIQSLGNSCPTCEQAVDESFKKHILWGETNLLNDLKERHEQIKKKIEDIKEINTKVRDRDKAQKEWEELYRNIDQSLPSEILDRDDLVEKAEEVKLRLSEAKAKVTEISKENERRTKQNTRIQVILEQTDAFTAELNELLEKLTHEKELAANLEVLKKAFSTNGLLAYKIENLVKELEELTNHYLAELSDGRFTLEFVVSNDKLNIEITDNGNVVDILALSSGELARVNTSTLLAIRKLMSSISKSRINILFLDEVINVLDEAGKERLVEVLIKEEELNTYIVSHQWEHPLLSKVTVVKENNASKVEV